jgi:hypothetical protein
MKYRFNFFIHYQESAIVIALREVRNRVYITLVGYLIALFFVLFIASLFVMSACFSNYDPTKGCGLSQGFAMFSVLVLPIVASWFLWRWLAKKYGPKKFVLEVTHHSK